MRYKFSRLRIRHKNYKCWHFYLRPYTTVFLSYDHAVRSLVMGELYDGASHGINFCSIRFNKQSYSFLHIDERFIDKPVGGFTAEYGIAHMEDGIYGEETARAVFWKTYPGGL